MRVGRAVGIGGTALGAAMATNRPTEWWPWAALGLAVLCASALMWGELQFSAAGPARWQGEGGRVWTWFSIWRPLGRLLAPAWLLGMIFHAGWHSVGPSRIVSSALVLLLAVGAFLPNRRWSWGLGSAGTAGFLVLWWGWGALGSPPPAVGLAGIALVILSWPEFLPHPERSGTRLVWPLVCLGAGLILGVGWRVALPAFLPDHRVLIASALWLWGWAVSGPFQVKPRGRIAAVILAFFMALVPGTALVFGVSVWVLGQTAGLFVLWAWLRRSQLYMFRPWGWGSKCLAGMLALAISAAAFGLLRDRWVAGFAIWFLIPPLIDAYVKSRFPFRQAGFPDSGSLAE